jgi:hypothetical protein
MSQYLYGNRDAITIAQQSQSPAEAVTQVHMDHLMLGFMRLPSFLDEARNILYPRHFDSMKEQHYRLLWLVLCDLRDRCGQWTKLDIQTECHARLAADPTAVVPHNQPDLLDESAQVSVVAWAFTVPPEEINASYLRSILRTFLQERAIASPLRRMMESLSAGCYPANLNDFLDTINQQRTRIEGVNLTPIISTVPAVNETLPPPSTFHRTGVGWLDNRLDGQREGDVNGILGVTGAGKSTLASYMAVQSARVAHEDSLGGLPQQHTALFTYEESARKLHPRIWSAAMRIRRSKLESLTNPSLDLTTRENMEEYERKDQPSQGEQLCEQERWMRDSVWLNRCLNVYDMSGSREYPNAGQGYIPELAAILDTRMQEHGEGIRSVFIDYAGIMAKRYMYCNNIPEEKLRYFIAKIGDDLRRSVAERFNCTVWLFHQIAVGQAGTRTSTSLLDHTMAAESKAFSENQAVAIAMGARDQASGVNQANFSKIRYKATEEVPPAMLRIHNDFAIVDEVGEDYVINESGNGFITRGEAASIGGSPSGNLPQPSGRQINQTNTAMQIATGNASLSDNLE